MDSADPRPLVMSQTPGALQRNWKVPALFPLCPPTSVQAPIPTYFEALYVGDVAVESMFGETAIEDVVLHPDGTSILILGDLGEGAIKRWSLVKITFEDGHFVHESRGTFFERDGAEKQFNLAQGLPWEHGDSIDDYC